MWLPGLDMLVPSELQLQNGFNLLVQRSAMAYQTTADVKESINECTD